MSLSRKFAAFMIALCMSTCAFAEFYTGKKLKGLLEKNESRSDYVEGSIGLGYVIGVFDARTGLNFCPPEGVTAGQVASMTLKTIRENPEELHRSGDVFVITALRRAWPCPDKPQGMDATPSLPVPAAPSQKSGPSKSKPRAEPSPF